MQFHERLFVFENEMLRKIREPRVDPVRGRICIRTNEKIWRLIVQLFITIVIKSPRLRWGGHVARAPPTRVIQRALDNFPTSPRFSGRSRLKWEEDASRLGVPS